MVHAVHWHSQTCYSPHGNGHGFRPSLGMAMDKDTRQREGSQDVLYIQGDQPTKINFVIGLVEVMFEPLKGDVKDPC